MYKNAAQYLGLEKDLEKKSDSDFDSDNYGANVPEKVRSFNPERKENFQYAGKGVPQDNSTPPVRVGESPSSGKQIKLEMVETPSQPIASPSVWGPSYWFNLHVAAAHYPINPSPIVKNLMKWRILAIPYEVPCAVCKSHIHSFLDSRRNQLEEAVSSRDNLIKFYVDFHNQVNKRYCKRLWTYEEAKAFYSGSATVGHLKY